MLTLLRWRIRITIARYRRNSVLIIGVIGLLGVFALGVFGIQGMFAVFERVAPAFADAALLGAYAAVGVFQILAGFRWGVTRLFLDSDLEMLMCAPLTRRRLFGLKLVELVFASPISIGILVAVTWGYARARGMPSAPVVAIVFPFVLAAVAALPGMLVALVLARAMIGPRLRALIGVMSALLPLVWVLIFSSGGSVYARITERRFDAQHFQKLGRSMLATVQKSPTSLPGDAVRGIANGNWAVVGRDVLLIVVIAAVLVAATFVVFFATFEKSWTRLVEASTKRRSGTLLERLAPPVPGVARAIVVKEWRGFTRDLRTVQSLVFPFLFIGFFAINSMRQNGSSAISFLWIVPFMISNQAASALLMERRNIGFLKLAPIRGIDVITGKAIAYVLPTSILLAAVTVAIGVTRHLGAPVIALAVVGVIWILTGCMFGGIGIAARWGKFDLERPRLGIGPVFLEMAVLVAFSSAQGAFGFWIAGRFAHHSVIVGSVLLVLAAGTAAIVALVTGVGARRLELIDAP